MGAVGLELAVPIGAGGWSVMAWLDGADIRGRDGDATADVYFASFGVGGRFDARFGADAFAASLSLGLGALANGLVVDEDLRLDTWSLGGRARAFVGPRLGEGVALGVVATLAIFSAPLDADTWFNKPLRGTRYLTLGLGVDIAL
ncbi:MAG: hypothetical protein KC635_02690 [Myxococcales bacterium]|nr:hypothetical protein [Myxococcales bacterium]MCB9734580.1 hypothetical protein [Deltaproteobacteria bacterium]